MTLSRGNGHLWCVSPPCRNGETILATGSALDAEAELFQHCCELAVGSALLGIDPDRHDGRRAQKMHEPVQRGFEGLDRAPPPVEQRHVILTVRQATGRRRPDAVVSAAMQLEHGLCTVRTCHDDAMK